MIWACRRNSPCSGRAPLTYQLAADFDHGLAITPSRRSGWRTISRASRNRRRKIGRVGQFVAALFFPRPQNPADSAGVMAPLFFPRYVVALSVHCVATIVTFCTVFASADTPGPAGLMIRLLPEIAKVALSLE